MSDIRTVSDLIDALLTLNPRDPLRILSRPGYLDSVGSIRQIEGRVTLIPSEIVSKQRVFRR